MAHVQSPAPVAIAANPQTISFSSSVPAGALIIVRLVQHYGDRVPRAVLSVSDNVNSGNYTQAGLEASAAGTVGIFSVIYYKIATATGTPTISVAFDGGIPNGAISISQYDTEHTILGASPSSGAYANSTTHSTGAVTPTGSALYITSYSIQLGYATLTDSTGWNVRAAYQSVDGSLPISHYGTDFIGSGAQNPGISLSTALPVSSLVVAFESSGGGGGGGGAFFVNLLFREALKRARRKWRHSPGGLLVPA